MARAITEFDLQRAFCIFLDKPGTLRPNVVYFHVPNGGSRNAAEGARFKQIGVKAGIPDLVFFAYSRFYLMEWKVPNGRAPETQLSPAQREMHPRLIAAGATNLIVVDNLRDARMWAYQQALTFNV